MAAGGGQGGRRCRSLFHEGCGSGCVPGLRCRRWGACLPRAAVSPRRRPSSCIRPRCRGVRHGGRPRCRRPNSSPPLSPAHRSAPSPLAAARRCERAQLQSVRGGLSQPTGNPAGPGHRSGASWRVSWRPRSPLPPRCWRCRFLACVGAGGHRACFDRGAPDPRQLGSPPFLRHQAPACDTPPAATPPSPPAAAGSYIEGLARDEGVAAGFCGVVGAWSGEGRRRRAWRGEGRRGEGWRQCPVRKATLPAPHSSSPPTPPAVQVVEGRRTRA